MTLYARCVNNIAVEIFMPPENFKIVDCFHADVVTQFVEVPDDIKAGATYTNGIWINPIVPTLTPTPTIYPTVSVPTFKSLFTFQEEMTIEASTDSMVKTFLGRINDARVTEVNLNLASVQQGLEYLVTLGILTAVRIPQILTGVPQ